jgi:VPS62-like protein
MDVGGRTLSGTVVEERKLFRNINDSGIYRMMQRIALIHILLCLISVNAIAEAETTVKLDLADIEAQERQQIIKELSFSLDTTQTCTQTLSWDDSGSGADLDGYFFIPTVKKSEYMIGGHASGKRKSKYHCVLTVSEATTNPKGSPPILVAPKDWKQVWKDSGSGATKDGSFWQAIPPDNNYRCLGSVSQLGHNNKPKLSNYRCVHTSLTEKIVASNIVWSDQGTGADQQVTIFGLPNTGSFIAIPKRVGKAEAYDLRKNASSVPDPKTVDAILAKRMAPIKADIEAKTKALQEQKLAAEKAEQKKIAEEIENKRQAKAAKEKRLAKMKEAKKVAEETKEEVQTRLAEAAEKVEQKKIIEQQLKATEEKAIEETAQQAPAQEAKTIEQEPKPVVEEPAQTEEPIVSTETASTSESKKGSKSLNDLMMDIVKVFLLLAGGFIFMVVVFKFAMGKKTPKEK